MRSLNSRREALLALSAAQRMALAQAAEPFASKLAAVDRAVAVVREHSVLAMIAAGAVALLGPRKFLHWALRAAPVISLLRRAL